MNFSVIFCIGLFSLADLAYSAPADHLAQVPVATKQEAEIISLLQVDKPRIDASGNITIPLYNPTKYDLTSCAVRVTLPTEKIDRIYYSGMTAIPPFKDGEFSVSTSLTNKSNVEMKCEIITLSYKTKKD